MRRRAQEVRVVMNGHRPTDGTDQRGVIVERDVRVPMRDGVELATDVHRPDDERRHPVLLERTPYDRGYVPIAGLDTLSLIEAGYVIVTQDCRGRFGSGGTFTPFVDEAADGVDAIAWCAAQPWSNGRVGMIGGSYVGATQWLPAGQNPPALKAIAPHVTGSDYHEGWVYQGGAFQLGFSLRWSPRIAGAAQAASAGDAGEPVGGDIAELRAAVRDIRRAVPAPAAARHPDHAPRALVRRVAGASVARRVLAADLARRSATTPRPSPALNIAGWYDIFADGTYRNFAGHARRRRVRRGAARRPPDRGAVVALRRQWHLRGAPLRLAWPASAPRTPPALHRQFFDRWLGDDPPSRRRAPTTPPGPAVPHGRRPVAARRVVAAAGRRGAGLVSCAATVGRTRRAATAASTREAPTHEEPDAFLYDPRDPVPTMGGATLNQSGTLGWNSGPWDQRPLEGRPDVLVYTSAPLERPLTVIGPVEAVLFVVVVGRWTRTSPRSSSTSTRRVGRRSWPTASCACATGSSLSDPEPLEPGRVEEIRIKVGGTANVFQAGHRIRLDVSSSNFPRFDANTNTGGDDRRRGPRRRRSRP